jgi:hypothetical protein
MKIKKNFKTSINSLENKCIKCLARRDRDVADVRRELGVIEISHDHEAQRHHFDSIHASSLAVLLDAQNFRGRQLIRA